MKREEEQEQIGFEHDTQKLGRRDSVEEEGDSGGKVGSGGGGKGEGFFRARFAVFRVAFNEDGGDAELCGEEDVGVGVSDEDGGGGGDLGKLALCLEEESGGGFAAVAGGFVVGADVEGVDACGGRGEELGEVGVDLVDGGEGVFAESYAALVGDDEDAEAGCVEAGDGLGDAGQEGEEVEGGDVFALREFAVDDSVTIKEDGAEGGAGGQR